MQAISDTNSPWMGVSASILNVVINQTGAHYDSMDEVYAVDCSRIRSLPDLVFTINGIQHHVPSEDYVLDFGFGEANVSACASASIQNFSLDL